MKSRIQILTDTRNRPFGTIMKSLLIGLSTGLVVSAYRQVLGYAESFSFAMYTQIRTHLVLVLVLSVGVLLLTLITGWMRQHFPMISGSGIPQIKGILSGALQDTWYKTLPAKFIGGVLAMLAGLSLGREGPSIQLGGSLAQGIGEKIAKTHWERRILIACGASAGLSVAFGAPLAGVLFGIEELFGYISPLALAAAMVASVSAQFVGGLIFGLEPVFTFDASASFPLSGLWSLLLVGIVCGVAGAFYNLFLIRTQTAYNKTRLGQSRWRALPAYLSAMLLGLFFPVVLGGGHAALQLISRTTPVTILLVILVIKFLFSMLSFESGAPGGIFFPLLIMGALIGALCGKFFISFMGLDAALFDNYVVYAMAGLFTGIVRAPLTGIILLLEMTGSLAQLLPFSIVAVSAYVSAGLLKSEPVYDALLRLQLVAQKTTVTRGIADPVVFEMVVHDRAEVIGKSIAQLHFPGGSLIISLIRNGEETAPNGTTILQADDHLFILCDRSKESKLRNHLDPRFNT